MKNPENFPPQIIVMDSELLKTRPEFAFYLRIEENKSVKLVDLDNARTLQQARKQAVEQGFKPTHWARTEQWGIMRL